MMLRSKVRQLIRRIQTVRPKPLILMYHRIADVALDYWGLSVSPTHFEEHLEVLRRTRYPLPLGDFIHHLKGGTLRSDAVALTFDDGYVDNLFAGKPRLVAADIPATVFLATGYLDRPGEFWWDRLTTLILLENSSKSFELVIGGETMHFDFNFEKSDDPDITPQSQREATLMRIWQAMRRIGDEERKKIMIELQSIFADRGDLDAPGRAMTRREVRQLVSDGLIAIGAHTVTHPVLSELSPLQRDREIADSKASCEAIAEAPVAGFSYPYGNFSEDTRNAVKAAGFDLACCSRFSPTDIGCDVFALPRINIRNSNGDVFEQSLREACAVN